MNKENKELKQGIKRFESILSENQNEVSEGSVENLGNVAGNGEQGIRNEGSVENLGNVAGNGEQGIRNEGLFENRGNVDENDEKQIGAFLKLAKKVWNNKLDCISSKEVIPSLINATCNIPSIAFLVAANIFPLSAVGTRVSGCLMHLGAGIMEYINSQSGSRNDNERNDEPKNNYNEELVKLAFIGTASCLAATEIFLANRKNWDQENDSLENIRNTFFNDVSTLFSTEVIMSTTNTAIQVINVLSKKISNKREKNDTYSKIANLVNKTAEIINPLLAVSAIANVGHLTWNDTKNNAQKAELGLGIATGSIASLSKPITKAFTNSVQFLKSTYNNYFSNETAPRENTVNMSELNLEQGRE